MNYLTNYYKHLSEQLQAKINLLEAKLHSTGELAQQDEVNDSLEEGVKKVLRSGDKEKIAKEVTKQKLRGKKSNKEFHETKKELRDAKSELKFKEETKELHSNSSLSRTKKEVKNLEKKLSELGEPRANFKKNIKKLEAEAEKE